jgi:hypothetical protein
MNVEIGTEAAQFPENEYQNGIFVALCATDPPPPPPTGVPLPAPPMTTARGATASLTPSLYSQPLPPQLRWAGISTCPPSSPMDPPKGVGPSTTLFFFFSYNIQHCFICRPSDSSVPTDAGIEPRTVATCALAVRRSNH